LSEERLPLYPGVVQSGPYAVCAESGIVLAEAPHCWTQGCATIDEQLTAANGYVVTTRSYLDPATGRRLLHEILRQDGSSSFESSPDRWAYCPLGTTMATKIS
jgi:N-methylhydantoinase B